MNHPLSTITIHYPRLSTTKLSSSGVRRILRPPNSKGRSLFSQSGNIPLARLHLFPSCRPVTAIAKLFRGERLRSPSQWRIDGSFSIANSAF